MFGRRVAVVVCEFDFLAGSIGVAAAERITAAVERATAERLPLLASPSSGGTRMQEGTVAFLQMVKIAAAVTAAQAGAPALPGLPAPPDHRRGVRVVGFAGPCHRRRAGRADRVPRPAGLRAALRRTVPARRPDRREPAAAWRDRRGGRARGAARDAGPGADGHRRRARAAPPAPHAEPVPDVPAWDSVLASRRPDRPGVRLCCCGTAPPTGCCCRAPATARRPPRCWRWPASAASRRWSLGQQRVVGGIVGPAALREARRGMALAAGLRLPLVLVIDTAGPGAVGRGRAGRAGRRDRPAAWPSWSRWTPRRCRCCSARAAAGRRWRWCPPTGCWPRCTAGWRRCRRRAPARSSSATPSTPRNCAAAQGIRSADLLRSRDRRRHRARASRRRRRAGRVLRAAVGGHRRRSRTRCARCPTPNAWPPDSQRYRRIGLSLR